MRREQPGLVFRSAGIRIDSVAGQMHVVEQYVANAADIGEDQMEALRIGILGAARISELSIVGPARTTGDRLVAVAARDPHRARAFAERHGIERVVASYADLVSDPEVEVVYNPLANALHGPWNLAAVEAGRDVLTEKPFASNAVEARDVCDAARKAGVIVLEGFHYLFHPAARRLLEIVASGEIGVVRRVETDVVMPAPADDDPRWSLELAGGALMDLGCYGLHALRRIAAWAGGDPLLVGASGGERAGRPGVDEWLTADFAYPDGATGRAHCNMAGPRWQMTWRVVGDRGEVKAANFVQPHFDDRLSVGTSQGDRVEVLGRRSSYTYQLEALRKHLREGVPLPIDLDDALRNAELIDDCYRAAGFAPRPGVEAGSGP